MIVETRNNENAFNFEGSIVFITPTMGPADNVANKIAKCYWPEILTRGKRHLVSVEEHKAGKRNFYALVAYTDTGWINPGRTMYRCLEKIKANKIALVLKKDDTILKRILGGLRMSKKNIYLYLIDDVAVLDPA